MDHQTTLLHVRRLKGIKSAGEKKEREGKRLIHEDWACKRTWLWARCSVLSIHILTFIAHRQKGQTPHAGSHGSDNTIFLHRLQLQVSHDKEKIPPLNVFFCCSMVTPNSRYRLILLQATLTRLTFLWLGTRLTAHNKIRPTILFFFICKPPLISPLFFCSFLTEGWATGTDYTSGWLAGRLASERASVCMVWCVYVFVEGWIEIEKYKVTEFSWRYFYRLADVPELRSRSALPSVSSEWVTYRNR